MRPISRPKNVLVSARWKTAAVRLRAIEEACAVGGEKVMPDHGDVSLRLLGREQLGEDAMDHR
jgi:hypothetical protein